MNNIAKVEDAQVFENVDFGRLTVLVQGGNPWFVAKEIADMLGYAETRSMTRRLEPEEKDNIPEFMIKLDTRPTPTETVGVVSSNRVTKPIYGDSMVEMTVINESGLYSSIFGSKKPEAKAFKKWVTSEVLPSIRKHGVYATEQTIENFLDNPDLAIQAFTKLKEEREARKLAERIAAEKEQKAALAEREAAEAKLLASERQRVIECKDIKIQADAPKVKMYDEMINSDSVYSISSIASYLGTTAKYLNSYLHLHKIQYRQGGRWFLYQEHRSKGYTKDLTRKCNGKFVDNMYWTAEGREAIIKHWNLYN